MATKAEIEAAYATVNAVEKAEAVKTIKMLEGLIAQITDARNALPEGASGSMLAQQLNNVSANMYSLTNAINVLKNSYGLNPTTPPMGVPQ